MSLKLLSAAPSPYARKVRIALAEKDIPFELVTTIPWNADTPTPEFNPLEKIPVLILEDGTTVFESRHILEWLEVEYPDPALYPADPRTRLLAKRFEVLADGICDAFVLHYLERKRAEAVRSRPWQARQMRKIEGGMRALEEMVPADGFCVDGRFSIADIAAATVADYFLLRFPEYTWQQAHPKLERLRARLTNRSSFKATAPAPQTLEASVV